jgi:hypothetical protein
VVSESLRLVSILFDSIFGCFGVRLIIVCCFWSIFGVLDIRVLGVLELFCLKTSLELNRLDLIVFLKLNFKKKGYYFRNFGGYRVSRRLH